MRFLRGELGRRVRCWVNSESRTISFLYQSPQSNRDDGLQITFLSSELCSPKYMLTIPSQDDTFQKSADLGAILGQIVVGSLKGFTAANNALMRGENYQSTGDLRTYLNNGAFVAFNGVDKVAVIDAINNFLIGNAINQLWRVQVSYIY